LFSQPCRWIAVLLLVGLAATDGAGYAGTTKTIEGRIVGVHDGDTVTMLDAENRQHKIRLDGIDAPELGQPFGGASKKHLAELVFNQVAVAECGKTDRLGRQVCKVVDRGCAGETRQRSRRPKVCGASTLGVCWREADKPSGAKQFSTYPSDTRRSAIDFVDQLTSRLRVRHHQLPRRPKSN
jgi:hypothetical protein